MRNLPKRLRALRQKQGLTQEELATLLDIKKASVSAWENGKSAPKLENMDALRSLYKVPVDEIIYGYASAPKIANICDTVPVILWKDVALGKYYNLKDSGVVKGRVPIAVPHSEQTFATVVVGHSMTNDSSRSYPEGRIIFCDPSLKDKVITGQRVIARVISSGIYTFKEYVSEDGIRWLRSLSQQPQYQPITEPFEVIAVVIGSHIPE